MIYFFYFPIKLTLLEFQTIVGKTAEIIAPQQGRIISQISGFRMLQVELPTISWKELDQIPELTLVESLENYQWTSLKNSL